MSESLLDELIENAFQWRATAIHLEPFKEYARIRYRIDGVLSQSEILTQDVYEGLISQVKSRGGIDLKERRRQQFGRTEIIHENASWEIQIWVTPSHRGEAAVMCFLLREPPPLDLLKLGFTPQQTAELESLEGSQGLVLVAGFGGTGKTTTTYAMLTHLQRRGKKVITVEDIVLRNLLGVRQYESGYDPDRIQDLMRAALRQAPDVLFVGGLRNLDFIEAAISASQKCLVIAHVNTLDASSSLIRLFDMGAKPSLIAANVKMVIAQRLARRVCKHCAISYTPSIHELRFLCISSESSGLRFVRNAKCSHCRALRSNDLTVIAEVMPVTPEIRQALTQEDCNTHELRRIARSQGVGSLHHDAAYKTTQGIIASTEVHLTLRWEKADNDEFFF